MTVNTDISYISEFEKNIIALAYEGIAFEGIAHRYNISVDSVCQIYHNTLKKAEKIVDKEKMQDIEYTFHCRSTEDFMLRMGMSELKEVWKDVFLASIKHASDFPKELDDMTILFYPNIAKNFNAPTSRIASALRNCFYFSYRQRDSESQLFFKQIGVYNMQGTSMSKLLKSAVSCINDI